MSETAEQSVTIDVRPIPKPQRHPLIFDALEKLAVGESLSVHNDHNPIPLRRQVEAIYGAQFEWDYLEKGPLEFRLRFVRRAAAPAGWGRPEPKGSALPMAAALEPAAVQPEAPQAVWADLLQHSAAASHFGPQWAHESEQLDVTLLTWGAGKRIEPHVNNEVDGVLIGIEGTGVVTVDGTPHELRPGVVLLIPKGCERAIETASERVSYLSVHQRRRGLMPLLNGRPAN